MNLVHFCTVIFILTNVCDTAFGYDIYQPFNAVKKYTWCKMFECCIDDHIPARFDILKSSLREKLYGQHLVQQIVVDALESHFQDKHPQKALTLSFHGWPGSGKNYVTKFIKDALYKEGSKSKYVHHFNARINFPLKQNVQQYQANLQNWIKGNVTTCSRSLFIFDEVDKMPEKVLDAIKPMIDYNDLIDGVDYRQSIFIFLSNTGGSIIKDHMLSLWEKGIKREDITLNDFETIIAKGAFNEEGGFHLSDAIKNSLIDHYIPFFPLEKEHVELCAKDVFHSKGVYDVSQEHIKESMEFIMWGPEPLNIFSTTGCKRMSQKVPLVIKKYRLRRTNTEL